MFVFEEGDCYFLISGHFTGPHVSLFHNFMIRKFLNFQYQYICYHHFSFLATLGVVTSLHPIAVNKSILLSFIHLSSPRTLSWSGARSGSGIYHTIPNPLGNTIFPILGMLGIHCVLAISEYNIFPTLEQYLIYCIPLP